MKVLNLYAGIGGNKKFWANCEITAIELNPDIAKIYKEFFPDDNVIVDDAHEYLLKHFKEFDFIWSSPPCPTHSNIRRCGVHKGQYEALYPDMTLYQEIILLNNFARAKFCIENVIPYYKPLIKNFFQLGRHYFWSNFFIKEINVINKREKKHEDITGNDLIYGIDLLKYDIKDKRKILRNMVDPEIGLYIFNQMLKERSVENLFKLF